MGRNPHLSFYIKEVDMKSFKKFVKEGRYPAGVAPGDEYGIDSDTGMSAGDITNADTLKKLNAYIGTIGNMEYLLPEHALNRLRTTLMKVGLSFGDIPPMEGISGSFDLPLTRFGGRFGKDENTPSDEFINDDGISHIIEGGLALKIQYEMSPKNNSCRVFAKIA